MCVDFASQRAQTFRCLGLVRRFGHLLFFFGRPKLLEVTIVNIFKGKALLDDGDGSTTGRNDEHGPYVTLDAFLTNSTETRATRYSFARGLARK